MQLLHVVGRSQGAGEGAQTVEGIWKFENKDTQVRLPWAYYRRRQVLLVGFGDGTQSPKQRRV